jgi:hypothetical protein
MKVFYDSPSSSCNNHPFSPFIIFSSNHATFELWGFFCPTKKLTMSWEQVAAM